MLSEILRKTGLVAALCGAVSLAALLTGPADAAGLLTPADGSQPALAIRDHAVNVVIEDGYAVTTVEQTFHNPHNADYEAIYSFPVPEKAAVSEFTYWIDGKPVHGEVLPKKKAREVYEEEKKAGHEAGLAEQDDYRTFDISVWPVQAGQDVRIRLGYIQPAHVDTGIGRYVYPLQEGGVDEQKLSFWTSQEEVTGRFSFDLLVRPAYPVEAVRLPSHPMAAVSQTPDGYWQVHMDNGAPVPAGGEGEAAAAEGETTATASTSPYRLDTDIVVYWRHKAGLPGSVDLVAHREASGRRGTFMMVLTPGDDLKPITEGRDWVFVLDVSGSMKSKFSTLAEGISRGLWEMRPEDRFRIALFNDSAWELTNGFQNATKENINRIIGQLRSTSPDRGTNLFAGLSLGLNGLDSDRSAGIVLVTDGVANVGETQTRSFLKLVDKKDVRLFTLVMGNSANRPLLESLSKVSGGTAVNVSNSDDIIGAVLSATSKLTHESLHDVKIDIKGVRTSDIAPARLGSLYRGQQLVVFGHYWGKGEAEVSLSAKVSGTPITYKTRFAFPDVVTRNPEIERLSAFAAIEDLMRETDLLGEDGDRKQAITDLAVEAGLVTPYTSMVVLREEIFAARNIERSNGRRLTKEAEARTQRAAQPVQARRVDQAQPAFQTPRASYHPKSSGGGAMDPAGMVLILLAAAGLFFGLRRRNRGNEG